MESKFKQNNVWVDEEIKLINEYYINLPNLILKELYLPNKTIQQITGYANKHGLFKNKELLKEIKKENAMNGLSYIGNQMGEKSPRWVERIETICDSCNSKLTLTMNDFNKSEKHFCGLDCMGKWMSENLTKENNPNFGNGNAWTEEMRRNRARLSAEYIKSMSDNTKRTKPEQIIFDCLKEMKVICEEQYLCKYYLLDFYLPENNLMIEVQGNFFHCNPIMNLENSRKEKILRKDRSKHTYIKKYYDIEILYLWEKDIINNLELCKQLIKEYIQNIGKLDNFHSFNYRLNNEQNKIELLNNKIIFDY